MVQRHEILYLFIYLPQKCCIAPDGASAHTFKPSNTHLIGNTLHENNRRFRLQR